MASPKLRFKEFDGEWSSTNLLDISALITKGTTPRVFKDGDINFLKIEAINGNSFDLNKCQSISREIHEKELKRSMLQSGDILFAIAGATIGKNAIVTDDILPANTNQALAIIRLKNINETSFVSKILNSPIMEKYIDENISVGAQPNLNLQQIGNFSFFKPESAEQTKIASFLSAVDEKIAQLTQKHELLSQYKQGMMQNLFSQQIRFKADDGSEFGEWEEKELKEVAQVNPKVKKLPDEFIYIDLESVEKGQLLLEKNISLIDAPSRAQRLLSKGDVLFQMVRPYQQNNYYFNLDGQYVASTGYAQIRTDLNSKFIYFALHEKAFLDEVMNRCTGTSYPAINSSDLSSIEIQIPCLEEQTKIANFLSAIDQKIEVVAQQIEQAKQWKKGLLQQMFV